MNNKFKIVVSTFQRYEPFLFGLFFLMNLIPLFSGQYFISFDGPTHLYNANIIRSLFFDENSSFIHFFTWNNELVPNWTSHFLLSFFGYFFQSFVAEKAVMVLLALLLCYGFRFLVKAVSKESYFVSYLIFPFVYMFFFFMGFYNFLIGLGIMFFSIGIFIYQFRNGYSLKNVLLLVVLLMLLFLTHAVPLAVFMIFIAIYFGVKLFKLLLSRREEKAKTLLYMLNKIIAVLAIGSIPFLLVIRYFFKGQQGGQFSFMSSKELFNYFFDMKLLVGLNKEEILYTRIFLFLILLLFFIGVVYTLISHFKGRRPSYKNIDISMIFFLGSIIMLILYLLVPFSNAIASYINTRFLLLFFMFFMIWLGTLRFPKIVKFAAVLTILFTGYSLNQVYYKSNKDFDSVPQAINKVSERIPEKSVILPLNYSSNWLYAHYSNFLGADRELIILENYECDQRYFPLKWNEKKFPKLLLGGKENHEFDCMNWKSNQKNPAIKIDYLFIIGRSNLQETSNCRAELDSLLSNEFTLVSSQFSFELYEAMQ